MYGHKNHKNTKAPARLSRALTGAMETPDTTFGIVCVFAASTDRSECSIRQAGELGVAGSVK